MPVDISMGVVWGTAAGASALLLVMGAIIIVLCWRGREKSRLDRDHAIRERRLSGYPETNFSITDADVARVPGSRIHRHSSSHSNYGPSRAYTSRENMARRPMLGGVSMAMANRPSNMTSSPSWPLPRRLTRSGATPLGQVRTPSLNPIAEKSVRGRKGSALIAVEGQQSGSERTDEVEVNLQKGKVQQPAIGVQGLPQSESFTTTVFKPKPLFYDKLRCSVIGTSPPAPETQTDRGTVPTTHYGSPRPRLPRSSSLCSQSSSLAPDKPVPLLPFNLPPPKRFRGMGNTAELGSRRRSGTTSISGDTTVFDDRPLSPFSRAETDFTSIDLSSPTGSVPNPEGFQNFAPDGVVWTSPHFVETCGSPPAVKLDQVQVPFISQKPQPMGNTKSLPRSESSGLSMSLLDNGLSRNTSVSSLAASLAGVHALNPSHPSFRLSRGIDRRAMWLRGIPPASASRDFQRDDDKDVRSKRATTSILQLTVGCNGIPLQDRLDKRPCSWSTSDSCKWNPKLPLQPGRSATLERGMVHKPPSPLCQSNNQALVTSTKLAPTSRQTEAASLIMVGLKTSSGFTKNGYFLPTPPSRLTHDPQTASNSDLGSSPLARRGSTYSQTLSVVELKLEPEAPQEPKKSVPADRNSSVQRSSGQNHNCQKKINLPPQATKTWSIRTPASDVNPLLSTDLSRPAPVEREPSIQHQTQLPEFPVPPCDPQYAFLFPAPPAPASRPTLNKHLSSHRIQPTSASRSMRIENSSSTARGAVDLRKSIMKIRMMNSESIDLSTKRHRRYLGIGGSGSSVGEESAAVMERGEG